MRTRLEHGPRDGDDAIASIKIETIEDYELATQRVAVLDRNPRDEAGEREHRALITAIRRWDASHDDATRWKE